MKPSTHFRCQQCRGCVPRWAGRCPQCGEWNTLVEETKTPEGPVYRRQAPGQEKKNTPVELAIVSTVDIPRRHTGFQEFDRVLGGGLVPGSFVLLGGDPGIGKTTLLLQALPRVLLSTERLLYVSGEESPQQIKLRADRLAINQNGIHLLSETCLEQIIEQANQLQPTILVIDSIQTMYTQTLTSLPGGVSQVQEVASQLMLYAKRTNTTTFIIGHVTKEGTVAGPKTLEHLVDTVLFFEGDRTRAYRLLRSMKNRFGPTHEIGIWTMQGEGLQEVLNPSQLFLTERQDDQPGTVITASIEGTRPLLVELQALVAPTPFPSPRRTATGFDTNRLALLMAVLEKRMGYGIHQCDVFLNLAGGLDFDEPAIDLAACAAIVSSLRDRPMPPQTLILGEVGLATEVRAVPFLDLRLQEAARLGLTRAIVPAHGFDQLNPIDNLLIEPVKTVSEALSALFQETA